MVAGGELNSSPPTNTLRMATVIKWLLSIDSPMTQSCTFFRKQNRSVKLAGGIQNEKGEYRYNIHANDSPEQPCNVSVC
jgi:hypothetical protein